MNNADFFSFLKLRGSAGINGMILIHLPALPILLSSTGISRAAVILLV